MSHTEHSSPNVFALDLEEFDAKVIQASRQAPVLVDFWADWCGPCHALSPHLLRAVDEREGAVTLAKVEVDEGDNMKLAGQFQVRGFPTVILFRDGEERSRFAGARATHWVRDWLDQHMT